MRNFVTLILCLITMGLGAQATLSGKVMEMASDEGLLGATVVVVGTSKGAITDFDGSFTINGLPTGDHTVEISYVGYVTQRKMVTLNNGQNDLGAITMQESSVGLSEVEVIASMAIDRKTPVAVSTITGAEVEALVGNQEYPEILRKTPSIYVTKEGGGFGDSRINVRGFNQRNTAVMINGIPVNDMENGWVYWSNWAGLSDVTSSIQVQRGLGASKLAVSSVGGSINIVTNAADFEQGGVVSAGIGNDGYQKYGVAYSTGLSESGWAFTLQATHTRGDGYVDGTAFRAWSYFGSLTKEINDKHTISVTALGAPQWHHQRLIPGNFDNLALRSYVDAGDNYEGDLAQNLGLKYNSTWGYLDGEEFNFRRNFYHKPKAFVNHYWNISDKTELKTSAYISLGRGGGTGPRGRLRTPGSIFDSFTGLGEGIHDADGLVRFDDIVRYNMGQVVDGWGDAKSVNPVTGVYTVSEDGRIYYDVNGNIVSDDHTPDYETRDATGSGFIRRASMNSHNWYGVLSTLNHELSDRLTLIAGFDGRYYKGIHYRRVENLLGADAYSSKSDINNQGNIITTEEAAEFGSFGADGYKNGNNVLNYYNDGLVNWLGLFAQVEYSYDKISIFAAASGSNQGFKRVDYFSYLDSDPQQETDWENILGGTFKAGANYNINEQHNVYFNGGYYSQQPLFDNVYINFVNDLNPDYENQTVTAFELGYGFRSKSVKAKLNLYSIVWGNRQFDRTEEIEGEEIIYQFTGVAQDHKGVELEISYLPIRQLQLDGMVSVGDWKYGSNFNARGTNIDTQQPQGERTIFADGLPVGDAAQTTFAIGANYEIINGLHVYADFYHAAQLYAEYDVNDDQFYEAGGEIVELPSYSLVDAGISYNFRLGESLRATARFNMNNVFDEIYISELDTNIQDDPDTGDVNEFYNNKGIYGFGRTWNAGVKLYF